MPPPKIPSFSKIIAFVFIFQALEAACQQTVYISSFDYKNINTATLVPVQGLNDTQNHVFTILKHSFEMQRIISHPKDTLFSWNGLTGKKTIYSTDSLILFFVRPNDTILRPCILLTHGNDAKYRSSWNEQLNFYTTDLAMRGYCVAYYENPSSYESKNKRVFNSTRKAFYNGFQSAVAADMYITQNAALLRVDTSKLFSGGLSFGAFCSLSLASADTGKNFSDSLFNEQGNFSTKSIYTKPYAKNIKRTFAIGGGLPKEDTIAVNSSKMGVFLDTQDNGLSLLFLHGRNDHFVSFDLTKFGTSDTSGSYFYAEGPRTIMNNIHAKDLAVSATLFVNCRGEHTFLTSVCGYGQPNCIQQYQWPYLNEPPNGVTGSSPYFTGNLNDTLLHYFAYMVTQVGDVNYIISDFLQPAILNTTPTFRNPLYFLQPGDSFSYAKASGHYVFRGTDCEGNAIVITDTRVHAFVKNEVNAYPNPSANLIYVESKEAIQSIRIYSILGTLVKEIKGNHFIQAIDVGDIATGEYIAVIQLKDEIVTKKINVIR